MCVVYMYNQALHYFSSVVKFLWKVKNSHLYSAQDI